MVKKSKLIWLIVIIVLFKYIADSPKKQADTSFLGNVYAYKDGNIDFQNFMITSNSWVMGSIVYDSFLLYNSYFENNPKVKAMTIDIIDPQTTQSLKEYLNKLESGISITILEPQTLENCNYGDTCSISLTTTEKSKIKAAKIAHALWLDKNEIVSWDLEDYNEQDLSYILDWDYMWESSTSIIDYNPSQLFSSYTNQFIRANKEETTYALLTDHRNTFMHYSTMHMDPWRGTSSLDYVLTHYYGTANRRIAGGCGHMSLVIAQTLRNLNIPAYKDGGYYAATEAGGHSSVFIPAIGIVNHGDDIYNGALTSTPFPQFLMPWDYFNIYVEPCGKATTCAGYWTKRYNALNYINYISQSTKYKCCNPSIYGYANCNDYITQGMGTSGVLTIEEIQQFESEILSLC